MGRIFGWDHEHQAVRHFNQTPASQNVSLAIGVVGSDELFAQTQRAAKVAAQGFSVMKESGPASTTQPSMYSVRSTPPRRGVCFVKNVLDVACIPAVFFQSVGSRESRNPAADNGNRHELRLRFSASRRARDPDW